MKHVRSSKEYRKMNPYLASSIAEGFADYEPTEREVVAAWQYLHDTGHAYRLQGWYGRTAAALLQQGVIKA